MSLNLYLISQTENNNYDTYDFAIVAAESEDAARRIHPGFDGWSRQYGRWASKPENVRVSRIGIANSEIEAGVILASFNAG